jgi:hypothetical protein
MFGRLSRRAGHGSITADTGLLQTLFILRPQILLVDTEKVQVVPREDAAVVAIAERWLHAVIAHRLQAEYADVAFAGLQHFLSRVRGLALRLTDCKPATTQKANETTGRCRRTLQGF